MNDLSPQARRLVDASRGGDDPTSQDSARVKKALVAGIAASALSVPTSAAAASRAGALSHGGAGAVTSTKMAAWVASGAAVGLATAGTWVAITGSWSHDAPRAPAALITTSAPAVPPVPAAPNTPIPPIEDPEAVPPLSAAAPPAKASRQKATPSVAAVAARAPQSSSLAAETALLQAARAALGSGDAHGALALLRQHAREYPSGALVEERLASQVFAACALGQRADAARAAAELIRRAPSSPLRARVLDSCAGDQ
jgi:hypothetical protein